MKFPFLTVAGALLLPVVAESLNDLQSVHSPTIPSDPAMNCLSNFDLIPYHHGENALIWCTNTTYLDSLERCTRDSCSPAAADLLDTIHSWCAEASVSLPPDQFSCSSSEASATQKTELKARRAMDDSRKQQPPHYNRYITRDYEHDGGISHTASIGIVFGIIVAFAFCVLTLCGCAETGKRTRTARVSALPVSEPRRGRATSTPPIETLHINTQRAERARTPTPPPPYVPAPEAAHLKGRPGDPQLPSYEDRPRAAM